MTTRGSRIRKWPPTLYTPPPHPPPPTPTPTPPLLQGPGPQVWRWWWEKAQEDRKDQEVGVRWWAGWEEVVQYDLRSKVTWFKLTQHTA